jgi:hypothetical protein
LSARHIWETITTWNATPGEDGGWYGSKPPESLCSGEPDYPHAVMRARIESLMPDVHDAQVFRDGRSVETWVAGSEITGAGPEADQSRGLEAG